MTPNRTFQDVRAKYFPRWDRKKEWRFEVVEDLDGAIGRCINDSKTIRVTQGNDSILRWLLIHEIAHAVTIATHSQKWLVRMENAAVQAEKEGEEDLAEQIRSDVKCYVGSPKFNNNMIYDHITDIAISPDFDQLTFEDVVDIVRREYGCPLDNFHTSFPRGRRVFDEARRGARAYRAYHMTDT